MTTNNGINNSFSNLSALVNGSRLIDNLGFTLLNFNTSGSTPVNSIQVVNANTGSAPYFKAVGSDTNVPLFLQGQGTGGVAIQGSLTSGNAAQGLVGEYITNNIPFASATSLSNGTAKDVTLISLTAGDWDIFGNIFFNGSSITNPSYFAWMSTTSATLPDFSLSAYSSTTIAAGSFSSGLSCPFLRVSIASTTTVYLSAQSSFSAGTATACGSIFARRAR